MLKNTSGQKIGAQLVSASDGSAFTGSVTVAVTVDAGTQATGSVGSGACAHEGGGFHTYAPAQAETNGDHLAFTFSGSGAVPVTVQVFTVIVKQTGDSYAIVNSGTHGNAALKTLIDGLIATVGVAGAGLTATASAVWSVATRVLTAATNLTTALATPTNITGGTITTVTNLTNAPPDSAGVTTLLTRVTAAVALASTFTGITSLAQWLGLIAGKQTGNSTARTELRASGAGSGTFDETTDSLEAIKDTASAPSAATIAAAVWDEDLTGHTTTDSAGEILGNVATGTPPTASAIADAVLDEVLSGHTTSGTLGKVVADILDDTDDIGAAGAGLTALATAAELAKVPKSDSNVTWNSTAAAQLQSEAADALNAYDPPTNAEMEARTLAAASYATAANLAIAVGYIDTEIQTLLTRLGVPASDVATILAAVKVQTDKLTFNAANRVTSDVREVNDVALTGDGSGTPWGPA